MNHGARQEATKPPAFVSLLTLLLLLDLALIALHIAKPHFEFLRPHHYSLEADRGIAEQFQYLKQGVVVFALLYCGLRIRSPSFFVWSAFFALLLYDDSHSLHERAGETLAAAWHLPGVIGLRPQDVGEIAFALGVGSLTLGLLFVIAPREHRAAANHSINIAILVAALAVCGVVIDALHVIAYFASSPLSWVLAVAEDGGELLVMTLITAYACRLAAHGFLARLPLPSLIDAGHLLRHEKLSEALPGSPRR